MSKAIISRMKAKLYVILCHISALFLTTLLYYSVLRHLAQNDYYLSAILAAATGAIWGVGMTNTLNALNAIRETKDIEYSSESYQLVIGKYRNLACICLILLFICAIVISYFNL